MTSNLFDEDNYFNKTITTTKVEKPLENIVETTKELVLNMMIKL